jgi:hypothetical protein
VKELAMVIKTQLWAALVAALVLTACGGGDGETPPQASDPLAAVPASASQSTQGMIGYLGSLPRLDAQARDPVSVNDYDFVPPTSETDEPQEVDG